MISPLEIQNYVIDLLKDNQKLVKGGCEFFAEDTHDVYDRAKVCASAGKLAVVVVSPKFTKNGACEDKIPVDGTLLVRVVEAAALVAEHPDYLRALDAAWIIAGLLDSPTIDFIDVDQTADPKGELYTATASFHVQTSINRQERN